jgi:hypothetical protein
MSNESGIRGIRGTGRKNSGATGALLLATLLLLSSCVKEDHSTCNRGQRIQVRYTHNTHERDLLSDRTGDVRIYLFNQSTGVLVDIIRLSTANIAAGYIDTELPTGTYTAIAWAGSSADMMQHSYRDARAVDPATQNYASPVVIGTTTMSQFRMMLRHTPLTGNSCATTVPHTANFDDLFFDIKENISITGGFGSIQIIDFDLVKNTCTLKVIVTGLEYLYDEAEMELFVTGKNWIYCHNNVLEASTPVMLYEPYDETAGTNRMEYLFRQQLLSVARRTDDPVMLHIRDAALDMDMVLPINVVDAIMQNPNYRTQLAIHKEDIFTIEVSILHDLSATITVNGFSLEPLKPNI